MERIMAMGASSTSVVYGNVGHAVKELVFEQFPKELFKDSHVSSEIGYRSIKKFLGSNTFTEIRKKEKPLLVIQPQFSTQEPSEFMNSSPIGKNMLNVLGGADKRYLSSLIYDSENHYRVLYRINHDKIIYECRIVVSTLNEQLDVYNNMRNLMSWDITSYYTAALESLIPRGVMKQIATLCHMDIDKAEEIAAFLQRMNAISTNPITYKTKSASSTDEFFMYYMHNLLVTFTNLDRGSANKKNMVDDYYEITFQVEVEFNMPAVYYIQGYNRKVFDLQIDMSVINPGGEPDYIPLCTIKNIYSLYPPNLDDKSYYLTIAFNVDATGEKDTLELSDSLKDVRDGCSIQQILTEMVMHGENPKTLLHVYLLKDGDTMIEGIDYKMVYETQTLEIYNLDGYATYRVLMYVNNQIMNKRRQLYLESQKSEKSKL